MVKSQPIIQTGPNTVPASALLTPRSFFFLAMVHPLFYTLSNLKSSCHIAPMLQPQTTLPVYSPATCHGRFSGDLTRTWVGSTIATQEVNLPRSVERIKSAINALTDCGPKEVGRNKMIPGGSTRRVFR